MDVRDPFTLVSSSKIVGPSEYLCPVCRARLHSAPPTCLTSISFNASWRGISGPSTGVAAHTPLAYPLCRPRSGTVPYTLLDGPSVQPISSAGSRAGPYICAPQPCLEPRLPPAPQRRRHHENLGTSMVDGPGGLANSMGPTAIIAGPA